MYSVSQKILLTLIAVLAVFSLNATVFAQESAITFQGTWKARVVEVKESIADEFLGNVYDTQLITAEVLTGPQKGQLIQIKNDFQKVGIGIKFRYDHNQTSDGTNLYTFVNIDRSIPLLLLVLAFIFIVVYFGRLQGLKSLIALLVSFLAIIYILLPGILNGLNPLLVSAIVASAVLFAATFFTHGFNRESVVAYGGTMISVLITGLFAICAVKITSLTGLSVEEAVFLDYDTGGVMDFKALLLGAMMIGFLGVLDDIAITQSAVVSELYNSNPDISRKETYQRAIRVGREHVSALVNTLVLAYTGAALPLLLYVSSGQANFIETINYEIFATEIVRIIVGSVGLIITVPIVTVLAVKYLKGHGSNHVSACKCHHH